MVASDSPCPFQTLPGNTAVLTYRCTAQDEGRMISELLRARLPLFSGTIRDLKYGNGIQLNGETVRVGRRVSAGDLLRLDLNCRETEPEILAEDIPLEILYRDETLVAINKPAGMVVHPTVFHQNGTLANALLGYDRRHGTRGGIHFVSRLDVGTSGLILVARNGFVQESLRRQALEGGFRKEYLGVVYTGNLPDSVLSDRSPTEGTVSMPIGRKPGSIMEREVRADGAEAVTHYRVLQQSVQYPAALLSFRLETGRTHQIRVHTLYSGFPLLGDTLYGGNIATDTAAVISNSISHQALHAARVTFTHPTTREEHTIIAPIPEDFRLLLKTLQLELPAAYRSQASFEKDP